MPIYYNKSHSITFMKGNVTKNSWTDFHMVPSSRPYVVPPPPRFTFVNLPRSNTILDLTTALTDKVTFDVSEGDWEFYIDHDLWNGWSESFDTISEFFDGSSFTVILDDQEDYSYYGQIYVSNYIPGGDYSRITLHYVFDVNTYKGDDQYTWNRIYMNGADEEYQVVVIDGETWNRYYTFVNSFELESGMYRFYVQFHNLLMRNNTDVSVVREKYRDIEHTISESREIYPLSKVGAPPYNVKISTYSQDFDYCGIGTLPIVPDDIRPYLREYLICRSSEGYVAQSIFTVVDKRGH